MAKTVSSLKKTSVKTSSLIEAPAKALFLLVPFVLLFALGALTMGMTDTLYVLRWAAVLFAGTLITLPIATKLFGSFGSGGFIMSQTISIVFVSLFVWTLTYMKIYAFNFVLVLVAAAVIGGISYGVPSLRKSLKDKLSEPLFIERIVIEECAFFLILTLMCYFKGFNAIINGQEKYMDYGFIMSMLRNPSLPANDMWLSGKPINYYYFGQFMYALLLKVSCIPPQVGYNIAMCTATAIPFGMSFSLGIMLNEAAVKFGLHENVFCKYLAGILTGCAVSLWGNSHSFFYDENSIGNGLLPFFRSLGFEVGDTDGYFYPNSTRYIGWNPEVTVNGGDHTIEEFPFYSYLVGDLHAHVISMMVSLLIAALMLALICKTDFPSQIEKTAKRTKFNFSSPGGRIAVEYKETFYTELILAAVLLGVAQMTSYWDFLIYFIVCSMALLVVNTKRSLKFTDLVGVSFFLFNVLSILIIYLLFSSEPVALVIFEAAVASAAYLFTLYDPCALDRTSFQMSVLFTLAHLTALPFNLNFDMISNSLGRVKNTSDPFQLYILWGTHVIIGLVFIAVIAATKNFKLAAAHNKKGASSKIVPIGPEKSEYTNPVQAFVGQRNIIDVFVCGIVVIGIMLLIAPEIFYVRDIYTSGYLRSNTMFKFTFAAFILLSVAMCYSIVRLFWVINKKGMFSSAALALALVELALCLVPAHYTYIALKQRCYDNLDKSNYRGLDGTAYLETYTCNFDYIDGSVNIGDYYAAVEWFNTNVSGSPVICEAYGNSYTDKCVVSAYTGLPTVFGWMTHEWLWRFQGIVDKETDTLKSDPQNDVFNNYITPRHNDIDIIYLSGNPQQVQSIVDKYGIEYIIIGNLEKYSYYADNNATFAQIGELVFSSGDLNVYKVTPRTIAAAT
ncbi:MAG: hypothetical protein IK128_02940 [Clostridiales bacterium]|nr:hypothetical protein [Clostridiales bacterium]